MSKEKIPKSFDLIKETGDLGFSSRDAGKKIRFKLLERMLLNITKKPIAIDIGLDSPCIITSDFADEAFGKLAKLLGHTLFIKEIKFINVNPINKQLIDKAIEQRLV